MSFEPTRPQIEAWLRHVPLYSKEIGKIRFDNTALFNKLDGLLKLLS
jgi:glutaredoxin 2